MNRCWLHCLVLLTLLAVTLPARAQVPASGPGTQPAGEKISVAILDFDAGKTGASDTGKHVAETLTVLLGSTPGIKLVDRAEIQKTLQEHSLNLTGLVDTDQAVKVGKLVGARLLITGKVFTLGNSTYLTAKIIGTETTLVEGVLTKGKEGDDLGELVSDLAEKLQKRLALAGPKLVASPDSDDGLAALKAKLAKLKRPRLSVNVKEEHRAAAPQPIDPAVETEIKFLLQQCDVTVITTDKAVDTPANIVVSGEAFSEFATRVGNLVSCTARVEINVVSRTDGKVLFTDRATARAADLSENIAAKTALQKAGHVAGLKILEYLAQSLPPADPAKK